MSFLVSDIVWDTDGQVVELPTEYVLDNVEDEDGIADALSDMFGWCVTACSFIEL